MLIFCYLRFLESEFFIGWCCSLGMSWYPVVPCGWSFADTLVLSPCRGLVQNRHPSPTPYPNHSGPSHLHKIMWGLHITYTHTPMCIKSSLDYLQYLIECKWLVVLLHCIVCGIMTRESLYLFSTHIILFSLNLTLVEFMNVCIHYILYSPHPQC